MPNFLHLPIQLLDYPIPLVPLSSCTCMSQKPSHGDISGTKRGIIDLLVSKRPEKSKLKRLRKLKRIVKNKRKLKIFLKKKLNFWKFLDF